MSKNAKILLSVIVVFGITLWLTRCIVIPPMPWKVCFRMALLVAFAQEILCWMACRRIPR